MPPQPSGRAPQKRPSAAHVVGLQASRSASGDGPASEALASAVSASFAGLVSGLGPSPAGLTSGREPSVGAASHPLVTDASSAGGAVGSPQAEVIITTRAAAPAFARLTTVPP